MLCSVCPCLKVLDERKNKDGTSAEARSRRNRASSLMEPEGITPLKWLDVESAARSKQSETGVRAITRPPDTPQPKR